MNYTKRIPIKEFQFGIDEPTPEKARKKLFKKIGYASYKWRFEVRDIEKEAEKLNRYKSSRLVGVGIALCAGFSFETIRNSAMPPSKWRKLQMQLFAS